MTISLFMQWMTWAEELCDHANFANTSLWWPPQPSTTSLILSHLAPVWLLPSNFQTSSVPVVAVNLDAVWACQKETVPPVRRIAWSSSGLSCGCVCGRNPSIAASCGSFSPRRPRAVKGASNLLIKLEEFIGTGINIIWSHATLKNHSVFTLHIK